MFEYNATPYSMFDTLKIRNNEYTGMYRGTVLNNEDPEDRGRCKVYVYGVYDEKFKEDDGERLPWAEPCQPLFSGGMGMDGDNGTFQYPDLNSTVWVFFDSGDITRPVMFGQTTDKNGKFDTAKCTIKWHGMKIEMNRLTNTVSVSANNVCVDTDTAKVNSRESYVNSGTVSLTSDLINVENDEMTINSSSDVTINAKNIVLNGGVNASGANGYIDGGSIATVKDGIIVAIGV